jgi:hypothetical protein
VKPLNLLLAVGLVAFVTACGSSAGPPVFDGSERASATGLFRGSITSTPTPPPVNEMHTWTLHLEDEAGEPLQGAEVAIEGDMPAHGHGLPTQPQVTEYLGEGDYLVEGMQFQMDGEWYVEFTITADGVTDTLRFDFTL